VFFEQVGGPTPVKPLEQADAQPNQPGHESDKNQQEQCERQ
jgi:hypothetical protein